MKKINKKLLLILSIAGVLFIITIGYLLNSYAKPNLYIKDFDAVSEDYEKIVDLVRDYYGSENQKGRITVYIDRENYTLSYENTNINMVEDEILSLRRIYETSYSGYNLIWVSEKHVIFWQDEANLYAIMYSTDSRKSKKEIKSMYKEVEFRKIKDQWYEFRYDGAYIG